MFELRPATYCQPLSFLLLPGFSLFGFSSMLAPLRHANRISGRQLYRWQLLSLDGEPVMSCDGIPLPVEQGLEQSDTCDCLLVCSGDHPEQFADARLLAFLRKQAAFGAYLAGQDTGAWLLAAAGLLDGYRSTLHWEYLATAGQQFTAVDFVQELFVIDRTRFACSGALSGLDMMLHLLRCQHGDILSEPVADMLIYSQPRPQKSPQKEARRAVAGVRNRHLSDALELMEVNLEEPLAIPEIARYLQLSVRELERLFRRYLKSTPQAWYRHLRLNKARRLLQQTDDSITAIAGQCGFRSLSHFSRCYRQQFQHAPSEER